jgi:hypothetical protein
MTRQWEACQLSDGEIHGSGDNYAVINKALPGFDCYLTYGSPYRSIFVQLPRPPASLAPTGLPSRPPTATPTDSPRMPQTHNPTRMPTKTPTDAPVRITGACRAAVAESVGQCCAQLGDWPQSGTHSFRSHLWHAWHGRLCEELSQRSGCVWSHTFVFGRTELRQDGVCACGSIPAYLSHTVDSHLLELYCGFPLT